MSDSISTNGSNTANPSHGTNALCVESHPLRPFIPDEARLLMLGSFPPPHHRWRMEFFYPNYQNDMWRIFGLILHGDADAFLIPETKSFRQDAIEAMLRRHHIAIYDAAVSVIRLDDNASDARLKVVVPIDLQALLSQMSKCKAIASTGGRSAEIIAKAIGLKEPPRSGGKAEATAFGRQITFYRMPSSSRAYPMKLERKAEHYMNMLSDLSLL